MNRLVCETNCIKCGKTFIMTSPDRICEDCKMQLDKLGDNVK